jgi:hypothetical protein
MIDPDNEQHIMELIKKSRNGMTRSEIRSNRLLGSLGVIQPLVKSGKIVKQPNGRYINTERASLGGWFTEDK